MSTVGWARCSVCNRPTERPPFCAKCDVDTLDYDDHDDEPIDDVEELAQ